MNDRLLEAINSAPAVAFSGSRKPGGAIPSQEISLAVDAATSILVGDASGLDAVVRIFAEGKPVSLFEVKLEGKGAFAERSKRMVRAIADQGGILLAYPCRSCPEGLKPCSAPFTGKGSGTWAAAAMAIHLGIPTFVWLGKIDPPDWNLADLGDGWRSSGEIIRRQPEEEQLSLFGG
jgi:hypothetical protein